MIVRFPVIPTVLALMLTTGPALADYIPITEKNEFLIICLHRIGFIRDVLTFMSS